MFRVLLAALAGLLLMPTAHADLANLLGGPPPVLSPQQAFAPELAADADGQLELRFSIAPDHYLYRDRLAATDATGSSLNLDLPAGEPYDDPDSGRVMVLRGPQRVALNVPARPGAGIELRYQGCAEGRLCYTPVRVHLQLP